MKMEQLFHLNQFSSEFKLVFANSLFSNNAVNVVLHDGGDDEGVHLAEVVDEVGVDLEDDRL